MRSGLYSYEEEPGALSFGARMRRRLRNLCHGNSSTSTRNAQHEHVFLFNNRSCTSINDHHRPRDDDEEEEEEEEEENSPINNRIINIDPTRPPRPPLPPAAAVQASTNPTLEEMIMQLELEDEIAAAAATARKAEVTRRMSCVNTSSDRVLRSARNALNQYPPRFSLDGKDAMYRSSFLEPHRRRTRLQANLVDPNWDRRHYRPSRSGYCSSGSNVVWCKPGVVPKLMGLDAIPVPVNFRVHEGPLLFKKWRAGDGDGDDVLIERLVRPVEAARRSVNI